MNRDGILFTLNDKINNQLERRQTELIFTFKRQLDMWISYFDRIMVNSTGLSDALYIAYFITELNVKCIIIKEYNLTDFNDEIGFSQRRFKQIGHRFEENFDLIDGKKSEYIIEKIKFIISKIKRYIKDNYNVEEKYENFKYNHNKSNCIFNDNEISHEMEILLKELVNYGRE